MVIVPSTAVDTMNLGSLMGITALGQQAQGAVEPDAAGQKRDVPN
jgi:hypothetical protein